MDMNRSSRNGPSIPDKHRSYPLLDEPCDLYSSMSLGNSEDYRNADAISEFDGPSVDFEDKFEDSFKERFRSFLKLSDNKQALKLFGNETALNKEKLQQKIHSNWIIHPCSGFRFFWNTLMAVLLTASIIELPVVVSFYKNDLDPAFILFHSLTDSLFLLDVFLNFRTGVVVNSYVDEIILKPREIARHYLKTWFMIDLVSSIPLDYIFMALTRVDKNTSLMHTGRALQVLRLIKIIGLIRLLRVFRLARYMKQLQELLNISTRLIGAANTVLLIILLSHWNACLQYLIPMLQNFPKNSWVQKCNLMESTKLEQYTWCLFNAVSHMLSIGYGRYPPTIASEAWITIISVLTGVMCYALFIGHATALIYSFDTSKRLYNEKFKQVKEYLAYMKLPKDLRHKIVDYYKYRYQGKIFNESNILGELSECLREEIINYNCRDIIAAVPIFTNADPNFISEVVVKLMYELYQPGNLIIKEGTLGTKMYFLLEGTVEVLKDKTVVARLSNGSFFGEICLLTRSRRTASIMAQTYCSIYSLDKTNFWSVLENYPSMRRHLEAVAAERLASIGKNPLFFKLQRSFQEEPQDCKETKGPQKVNERKKTL